MCFCQCAFHGVNPSAGSSGGPTIGSCGDETARTVETKGTRAGTHPQRMFREAAFTALAWMCLDPLRCRLDGGAAYPGIPIRLIRPLPTSDGRLEDCPEVQQ